MNIERKESNSKPIKFLLTEMGERGIIPHVTKAAEWPRAARYEESPGTAGQDAS